MAGVEAMDEFIQKLHDECQGDADTDERVIGACHARSVYLAACLESLEQSKPDPHFVQPGEFFAWNQGPYWDVILAGGGGAKNCIVESGLTEVGAKQRADELNRKEPQS